MPTIFICDKCMERSEEVSSIPLQWYFRVDGLKTETLCRSCNMLRLQQIGKAKKAERAAGMKKYEHLPFRMKKGKTVFERTQHGSYVDTNDYGMAAAKNAMSYEKLLKYGYKPC